MTPQEFIIDLLFRLRETGMSYGKIGKAIKLNKGSVKKLLDGQWYPKTRRAENKLLASVCKIKQEDFQK